MSATPSRQGALRLIAAPLLASLAAFAILITLGLWQLDRKAWKEGLLRQIETRAFGTPGEVVAERDWLSWRGADDEYRRVRVEGELLADFTIPLHGLAELRQRQATQGFYLFVPLRRDDGSIVLINRGFVPTELRDEAIAAVQKAAGRASIVGLVRNPETRTMFVPPNDPAKNEWWVRNLADMAQAKSLQRVAPFYIDADAAPLPGGWPRGGQTQLTLRNPHLQYAVTWFGLAATLVGVFGAFAWGRFSRRA